MKDFKIKLQRENLQDLIIAIEYTIDNYDLYKKEIFVADLKKLRKIIIDQINKDMITKISKGKTI